MFSRAKSVNKDKNSVENKITNSWAIDVLRVTSNYQRL